MFKFPTIERLADANAADDAVAPDAADGARDDAHDDAVPASAALDAGVHAQRRRHHYYQSRKHSMESKSE